MLLYVYHVYIYYLIVNSIYVTFYLYSYYIIIDIHYIIIIYLILTITGHLKRFDESIQYIVKDLVKVAVSLHRDIMSNFRSVVYVYIYDVCMCMINDNIHNNITV